MTASGTWVVTGAGGMLGRDLVSVLGAAGRTVRAAARADLDVLDPAACRDAVGGAEVVVNCAAWTAVDDAEEHEAEAFAVNAQGPANLARAARETGARLVHVSTDYVFDGASEEPYGVDDPTGPASAYGRTKLAGEWAALALCPDALVVRTAWLYGDGPCFPRTIARLLRERGGVDVVDDQRGSPTWSRDLADALVGLVDARAAAGRHHLTAAGSTSWHGFAVEVARSLGLQDSVVRPTTSDQFVRPAPRPASSVLAPSAPPLGPWRERWRAAAAVVLG